jgi:hypothetical protein
MAETLRSRTPAITIAVMVMIMAASCLLQACKNTPPPSQPISIQWTTLTDTNKVVVEVQGLNAITLDKLRNLRWEQSQWQRLFSIYAGSQQSTLNTTLPPTSGTYSIEANNLRFTPQFPMEPQVKYWATFQPDQLPDANHLKESPIVSTFQLSSQDSSSTTTVAQIYPSGTVVPENLLKFYIHFSAPMSRGNIYKHIHLLDSSGKEVELPFLELDEELWDPAMTRLTLIIDPGRIKRGVRPLEDIGPALESGKSYRLVISSEWKDGAGNPLKESFEKAFTVSSPDRETPNPEYWKVEPPKPETLAPLSVIFPEPMDNAVTQRVIQVVDQSGKLIAGKVTLTDEERRWIFTPEHPWQRGTYSLEIQTTIEDLAGNNIGKPFDVDTFESGQKRANAATVKLNFKID